MIFDTISNYKTYPYSEAWEIAFTFLKTLDASSKEKRYELDMGIFAEVSTCASKSHEEAVLESHKKYVDIQASLNGSEFIECFSTTKLKIKEKYNDKKDVVFYYYPGCPEIQAHNKSGSFVALWPNDAHMPLLRFEKQLNIKKVVIKIPTNLLT